jgi:hypothetical protein
VISLADFTSQQQQKIDRLTERSDDLSRCTGKITDIDAWLKLYKGGEEEEECDCGLEEEKAIRELMETHKDLVVLRESDESMGGEFSGYGLDFGEISSKALMEFEYH